MERIALVLGVTGGIGGAVARRLVERGWSVRALVRAQSAHRVPQGVAAVIGDAMDGGAVAAAAEGARVIVHAVNPPGYRDWDTVVLPMLDNTIAAARVNRAQILLPGTIYNYGPDSFPLIAETAPQHAVTRKGAIRVEMERRLRAAADAGDVRALIVRAGDFFGPGAANSWFAQGLITPGARPRIIRNPATRGVGHLWGYLPDVAETMVRLVEHDQVPAFANYHMGGHWDGTGTAMVEAIAEALGAPKVRIAPFPWWALRLAAPFAQMPRELMEMRYLWQQPVRLDNAQLIALLGEEPHTPLPQAVRATLAALGCMP
ncbi:NAD-dependent epimerase/dehydratase family protein [Novosphingobium capsulatum]|uniref:NAD-dependent epimerase/dehydratase family protein n=1 Tax=Novosphingobium capsulatum TaxID=13688 RepID=UPI000786C35E|nr:NAD-dependent epimerase/dehydratase family protein [Novosphingobium capsulatum]WQD91547.1 NAD-dependent epimerase/dehydratase family protein [Novosphingobium capsulatum]